MKECIFSEYFEYGVECITDYTCDECPIKYVVREIVSREIVKGRKNV